MGPVSDNTARPLPDVASDPREGLAGALDWVGMGRIEMPVTLVDGEGHPARAPARVDAFVNLARPEARGIHMSRLYLHVDAAAISRSSSGCRCSTRAPVPHRPRSRGS